MKTIRIISLADVHHRLGKLKFFGFLGIQKFPFCVDCKVPDSKARCESFEVSLFVGLRASGCATKASLTIFLQLVFLAFRSCNPLGFCDSPRMGQQQSSPGQSTAPHWVRCPPTRDCPEGAKLVGIGRMYRRVCSAPSGQRALRAVAFPRRRFALPWAKIFKPVGLKTQERNTAHNSIHASFRMH